jgi:lon-related putative ATP-dependent protease
LPKTTKSAAKPRRKTSRASPVSKAKSKPASLKVKEAAKTTPKSRAAKKKSLSLPGALGVEAIYKACPSDQFKFKDTSKIGETHEIISQDRAVRAINMGLGIRKPGYNIYVAGIQGTGKTSVIRTFLEKWSSHSKAPNDWIYVYDFNDRETPKAIELEPGGGRKLRKAMEALVKNLREAIPSALQSEDYENAVNAYVSASNERKSKLYADLERLAKSMEFVIKSTRMGIETIPVVDGRSLTEKEYSKLNDEHRGKIEDQRSQLEPEVLDFARKVRSIEQETGEYIETLRSDLGQQVVGREIDPIIETYKENAQISAYLKDVRQHILDNLLDFVEQEEDADSDSHFPPPEERDRFRKYRINVFVDNTNTKGAPVTIENNPTYYNLFGRVEKNVEHGMYLTDHTLIKSGAIHRANGGYLVLNAMDVFKTQGIWDTLKRVMRNRLGFIEDMGEQFSLLPTSGLRPEPIPLDVKVIMIGNDEIYHTLFDIDEDFHKIFKIKADFDHKMPRNSRNTMAYAHFIATRSHLEGLLPFDREGIAAVVEFGSRLVEDQRFLSTQFGEIKDLTIEADYIAREHEAKQVSRQHVALALDFKFHRLNLVEEHLQEMVRHEDILLMVEGERIGQVNGLAVYDMGDYSFGKIGRITCTISATDHGVINVERASKLSGKIHDKGMLILGGFLNALLATTRSIGLTASVCFEQSYGMIDGDSATVAELVAIISAMAEIPVSQHFAMTGSLNQFGEVQPVGGINEKIEGFYRTCQILGKKGPYNVIIPHQNVANLMLHKEVREGVKKGQFKIYPARTISEAFELATGVPLGFTSIYDHDFPAGSALAKIADRLTTLREKAKADRASSQKNTP